MKNFDNLLFLKDRNGFTNIEMAKIIGISDSQYSKYEKGKEIIPLKHLISYSDYFDVSVDYLLELTSAKKHKKYKKGVNLDLFCKRIKELRKEHSITQTQLAKEVKCSYSLISKYESKSVLISTICLYKICKKYKISADYVLGRINYPKYYD